jgi:hypothetical protein
LLLILVTFNLVWYVVASVGWLRYAFPGLALASLFVARFFGDLTDGFRVDVKGMWEAVGQGGAALGKHAVRWAVLAWLAAMILLPLAQTTLEIVRPAFNAPLAMAAFMDERVPYDALVETWEPEMGFLTDHNYHFPPQLLLNTAVGYMWYDGPAPAEEYDYLQRELPEYVLVGEFARWVDLYPMDTLEEHYELMTSVGAFDLYARNSGT